MRAINLFALQGAVPRYRSPKLSSPREGTVPLTGAPSRRALPVGQAVPHAKVTHASH